MRAVARYPDIALADIERPGGIEAGSVRELPLPGMDAELKRQTGIEVRAWIDTDGYWAIVVALATIANERALAVRHHFTGLDAAVRPATTPQRISEWACGTVAHPYAKAPALPEQGYLDKGQAMFQQREVDRAARVKNLVTDAEFVKRYTAVYDAMWDRRGGPSPATLSPVQLDLGTLDRPPMTATENSWKVGTDRSVRSRYRYYRRASWGRDPESVADAAGLDPDQHIGVRLLTADPDEFCRGELDRVCSPLGLRFAGHHVLVTAMVEGIQRADLQHAFDLRGGGGAPLRKGRGLTAWAAVTRDLPITADPALVAGVQERAEYWAFRGPKALESARGAAPRQIHWPTLVQRFVPRRLWHRLHCREVEWEAPLLRAEAARLVPQMFQKHLMELFERPISAPDADPGAEPRPVAPDDPRLLTTLSALAEDQAGTTEMIALLLGHDERWEAMYRRTTGPRADACLTVAEFRDWVLLNYGDTDSTLGGR